MNILMMLIALSTVFYSNAMMVPDDKSVNAARNDLLMRAVQRNDITEIKLLLAGGASVNSRDFFRLAPLNYATSAEAVDSLIAYGADVNYGLRRTPLEKALEDGNVAVAEKLIEAGADVSRLPDEIDTFLDSDELMKINELLSKRGIDVTVINSPFDLREGL